jgi:hypothetical protein
MRINRAANDTQGDRKNTMLRERIKNSELPELSYRILRVNGVVGFRDTPNKSPSPLSKLGQRKHICK